MNTNDILEYMISRSPWVNPETTVDNVKSGDGNKTIKKVGVCWYPSIKSIQSAINDRCDLLITHEPTWWDHFDKPGGWRQKGLGLDKFIAEDETRWHGMYEIPEQTLSSFARQVAERVSSLGQDAVQVIGDPEMIVKHPSIGVGCGGPNEDMIELGSDVLIMCFDGASYWKERDRFAEQGVGVITLEHGTTEMWGMESLAKYIQETWSELDIIYLSNHWKAWHTNAIHG